MFNPLNHLDPQEKQEEIIRNYQLSIVNHLA